MKRILIVDDSNSWLKHHSAVIKEIYADNADITLASSASEANDKLYLNESEPFDVIITDMQMESDYLPLYAGEWLIEQIQRLSAYNKTKIIIISATPSIRHIAERYGVEYLPKYNCREINCYKSILK